MLYREPIDLIIQIEDQLLGQLIYYWEYYNKPCPLIIQRAKAENLTGVRVRVDNPDAASLVFVLVERLKVRMYNKDKQPVDLKSLM